MMTGDSAAAAWPKASIRRVARVAAALALILACAISPKPDAIDSLIRGQRPTYGPAVIDAAPNQAAIDRMIWLPGLDAGWDPQGLTLAGSDIFVSAYRSRGAWQFRGPCRVFRIDPETGAETGHFDVPRPCGHAGGLAYAGGRLFVADTHTLFEFNLEQALNGGAADARVFRLGRGLKGAFAASSKGAIWIGDYQEERPATFSKFDLAAIYSLATGSTLTTSMASAVVPIPTYGQGAAVAPEGALWVARSDIGWGFLDKLDRTTGRFEARYRVPAGIEGIAFDRQGQLWCVSEAGARHLPWRYPFFPLIFRLDPARLAPAPAD
jgi:hypothetical protein